MAFSLLPGRQVSNQTSDLLPRSKGCSAGTHSTRGAATERWFYMLNGEKKINRPYRWAMIGGGKTSGVGY
ncbi:MAG: hypothetical protein PUG74_10240, partial [Prevotellaceae bacterium]|nr:hypothetical protein [Prevotellaceae bacterium]